MKSFQLSFVALLVSGACFAFPYHSMLWTDLGSTNLKNGTTATMVVPKLTLNFLKIVYPKDCGYVGFALTASGTEFDPDFIFDRNHIEYNAERTTYYFYTRHLEAAEIKKIYFEGAHVPGNNGLCKARVFMTEAYPE